MPPQYSPQPAPPPLTPPGGSQNPYHFILNPEPPKRQNRFLPNAGTRKGRLLIVLGGVFVLLITAWIVVSLLSSSGQDSRQALVNVAAHQQELARISQLGVSTAKTRDTKNLAITTQVSISSDQQQLLDRLNSLHIKVSKTQLNSRRSARTDAQLAQAGQANQFDSVFAQLLHDELISYGKALKTAYDASPGTATRALLKAEFNNADTLLGVSTFQPQ